MRPTRPNRWTIVVGATAVAGVTAGALVAATDGDLQLNDRSPAIELTDDSASSDTAATTTSTSEVDPSPESVDSPNESVEESIDSPFDSPDDPVDPSPESVDSPNESVEESIDSPFDS
ncbi:MAG: hypothetical protein AAFY28_15645, partial [Actinomycetota bacterium]